MVVLLFDMDDNGAVWLFRLIHNLIFGPVVLQLLFKELVFVSDGVDRGGMPISSFN